MRRKGERMTEEGTLGMVRHGTRDQIRYAANPPYAQERPPQTCQDVQPLRAFLHH
jgi:hypothetical protein